MIAIIDYGAGNIFSVKNALDYLGFENKLTDKKEDIEKADAIILPGVGAFPWAMNMLGLSGLIDTIKEQAKIKPFLGICLGKAFAEALGDKAGIARYGSAFVPMDEALAFCSLDISGRPFLAFNAEFHDDRIGQYDTCLTEEFFRAFAFNSGITLHIREEYGKNDHHIAEAMYKAVAHALKDAVKITGTGVLSTKGVL